MEITMATQEEIEKLKKGWLKDPCWDIEITEGFEQHVEELFNFRRQTEAEQKAKVEKRENYRAEFVRGKTGVADKDIVLYLSTWEEIEHEIRNSQRQQENFDFLAAAQIRATLLQAAQLKRIADALESMDDGDSLFKTAAIWGSGQ
jgi:hypothetical protein